MSIRGAIAFFVSTEVGSLARDDLSTPASKTEKGDSRLNEAGKLYVPSAQSASKMK
jgi:hypothetical protein